MKWSLERAADPKTQSPVVDTYLGDVVGVREKLAGKATEVSGVQVVDNRHIKITTDAPKAYFLAKLTYPTALVLDRGNVETNPQWLRKPNGTGPFMLTDYNPGEVIVLKKNPNYHLGAPFLDEVRYLLSGGDSMLMYQNDEIPVTGVGVVNLDVVLDPSNSLNKELVKAPPRFIVDYMGMNLKQAPFDDPKVRQALNYAIDTETLDRILYRDLVVPARTILPPGFPGYDVNVEVYKYDPQKARQLLAESKYAGKLPRITLTLPGSFGATIDPGTEAILEMWRQNLGVQVDVQQTEWATFLQDAKWHRFQMFGGLGWVADYPDPENFLDVLFHSKSVNNDSEYNNPEVDRLLEQARGELDQKARFELHHRIKKMILQDAPWVPLFHTGERYVLVKTYLKDWLLPPLIIPKLRYVYFTEKKAGR